MLHMKTDVLFSSKTCEWETPQWLYDKLNEIMHFSLDVCATPENAKCEHFYTKEDDALRQQWGHTNWMNPPYGRGIRDWVSKAYKEALLSNTTVALVPARTDTEWWHAYAMASNVDVIFIKGRLKFQGHKNNAPFPSALLIFWGRYTNCHFKESILERIDEEVNFR